ncbi:glycosyl transferase [Alteromonas halophila]|uniref:Glycosyl transferase n=1 Tax=Alteromonas halophila TaxID=516698 RepID=A0A918MTD2_9ALTE|nr:glycosyl transferase [Alteromonas halophila]
MAKHYTILHNQFPSRHTETLVAMAVYHKDRLDWVCQAVRSILSQTYTDFVFFVILDGEVPAKMVSELKDFAFQDNRLVLAQNEKNSGLAASMNHALEWGMTLSPEYFARMDADDESVKNRLERQISYLNKHRNIAVLGTALTEFDEQGRQVGSRTMPASHKQIVHMLPRRCSLNHPTVVLRYQVFHDGYRYDSDLNNTQDYFLWIELASQGYVFRNLKDKLLNFRRVNDFYKRRGFSKSVNEFRARLRAMRQLSRLSLFNLVYACGVLTLRVMPAKLVKLAYRIDRHFLERFVKH